MFSNGQHWSCSFLSTKFDASSQYSRVNIHSSLDLFFKWKILFFLFLEQIYPLFWGNNIATEHCVVSFFDRNSPVPCSVILGGNPLGFDITPFAQQLLQLGGRRRRGPDPWNFTPLNPGMRGIIPGLSQIPGSGNFVSPLNPAGLFRGGQRARRLY